MYDRQRAGLLTTVSKFERDRVPPRFRIVVMVPLWFERRVRVDDIESLGFISYEFIEDNESNARHSDEGWLCTSMNMLGKMVVIVW